MGRLKTAPGFKGQTKVNEETEEQKEVGIVGTKENEIQNTSSDDDSGNENETVLETGSKESEEEDEEVIPRLDPMISRAKITEQALEIKRKKQLPPPPGEKCSAEQMEEYLKLLDPDNHWTHIAGYVYRTYPVIQRKLSDPNNNIYIDFLTEEAVKEGLKEYMIKRHGGGKYKFIINDTEKRFGNTLITAYMNIPLDEAMPILDMNELDVNDKRNMGYMNLLKNGKQDTVQPTGTDTAAVTGQVGAMFKDFMNMYAQLSKDQQATINKVLSENNSKKDDNGVTQLLLERLKQDDPNKQISTVTTLMQAIQSMQPKNNGDSSNQMLTMMQASFDKQLEFMKLLLEKQNAAASMNANASNKEDDFLDKLLRYKEALPGLFGNSASGEGVSNPGKRSTTEVITDAAKELLLPVIGLTSQFLQMSKGVRPVVPVTPGQAEALVEQMGNIGQSQNMPMGQVQQPMLMAGNNPNIQQRNNVREMPNISNTPNTPMQDGTTSQQLTIVQQMLQSYGTLFINAIKQGMSGADMADSVSSFAAMLGTDVYGILHNQGFENIMIGFKSVPEFWNATAGVYGEPYMEKLVKDFLAWGDDRGNEDEDGMEGNAPVA